MQRASVTSGVTGERTGTGMTNKPAFLSAECRPVPNEVSLSATRGPWRGSDLAAEHYAPAFLPALSRKRDTAAASKFQSEVIGHPSTRTSVVSLRLGWLWKTFLPLKTLNRVGTLTCGAPGPALAGLTIHHFHPARRFYPKNTNMKSKTCAKPSAPPGPSGTKAKKVTVTTPVPIDDVQTNEAALSKAPIKTKDGRVLTVVEANLARELLAIAADSSKWIDRFDQVGIEIGDDPIETNYRLLDLILDLLGEPQESDANTCKPALWYRERDEHGRVYDEGWSENPDYDWAKVHCRDGVHELFHDLVVLRGDVDGYIACVTGVAPWPP